MRDKDACVSRNKHQGGKAAAPGWPDPFLEATKDKQRQKCFLQAALPIPHSGSEVTSR